MVWQLLDFDLYLGGGLLTKVDRCTRAHSVESRAPFLRHSLIRFALGLPEDAKPCGRTGKRALRLAAHGLVEARLAPDRIRRAGVQDVEAAHRVIADHVAGRTERGRTLWTLLSLSDVGGALGGGGRTKRLSWGFPP
jgi:asparagine synthase (glutamine-hydrolysing)